MRRVLSLPTVFLLFIAQGKRRITKRMKAILLVAPTYTEISGGPEVGVLIVEFLVCILLTVSRSTKITGGPKGAVLMLMFGVSILDEENKFDSLVLFPSQVGGYPVCPPYTRAHARNLETSP